MLHTPTSQPLFIRRKSAGELLEKQAAAVARMPDDDKRWPAQVLSELHKQLPFLSRFDVDIELTRVEPEAGYAIGYAMLRNKTGKQRAAEELGKATNKIRVPVIVSDRLLQPFHVFEVGGKTYPLTQDKVESAMMNPSMFDGIADPPGTQSLLDQIYPPFQHRQGYGMMSGDRAATAGVSKLSSAPGTDKTANWKEYALLGGAGAVGGALTGSAVGSAAHPENRKKGALHGAVKGALLGGVAYPLSAVGYHHVGTRLADHAWRKGHNRLATLIEFGGEGAQLAAATTPAALAAAYRKKQEKTASGNPGLLREFLQEREIAKEAAGALGTVAPIAGAVRAAGAEVSAGSGALSNFLRRKGGPPSFVKAPNLRTPTSPMRQPDVGLSNAAAAPTPTTPRSQPPVRPRPTSPAPQRPVPTPGPEVGAPPVRKPDVKRPTLQLPQVSPTELPNSVSPSVAPQTPRATSSGGTARVQAPRSPDAGLSEVAARGQQPREVRSQEYDIPPVGDRRGGPLTKKTDNIVARDSQTGALREPTPTKTRTTADLRAEYERKFPNAPRSDAPAASTPAAPVANTPAAGPTAAPVDKARDFAEVAAAGASTPSPFSTATPAPARSTAPSTSTGAANRSYDKGTATAAQQPAAPSQPPTPSAPAQPPTPSPAATPAQSATTRKKGNLSDAERWAAEALAPKPAAPSPAARAEQPAPPASTRMKSDLTAAKRMEEAAIAPKPMTPAERTHAEMEMTKANFKGSAEDWKSLQSRTADLNTVLKTKGEGPVTAAQLHAHEQSMAPKPVTKVEQPKPMTKAEIHAHDAELDINGLHWDTSPDQLAELKEARKLIKKNTGQDLSLKEVYNRQYTGAPKPAPQVEQPKQMTEAQRRTHEAAVAHHNLDPYTTPEDLATFKQVQDAHRADTGQTLSYKDIQDRNYKGTAPAESAAPSVQTPDALRQTLGNASSRAAFMNQHGINPNITAEGEQQLLEGFQQFQALPGNEQSGFAEYVSNLPQQSRLSSLFGKADVARSRGAPQAAGGGGFLGSAPGGLTMLGLGAIGGGMMMANKAKDY